MNLLPENPYLLLTPGPLSTTKSVKAAMLLDWCTWDDDYNVNIVQKIRHKLVTLATEKTSLYSVVLMQGSGTFSLESVIGSCIPKNGKLLVISNGAYGKRIAIIATTLGISITYYEEPETILPDIEKIEIILKTTPEITHVAVVHCETSTGILNPVREIASLAKTYNKTVIVDAMSSFGGIPMDIYDWEIDYLVSSANKCIQGVPGFGFIVANKKELIKCKDLARSYSLNLYDQWETMEKNNGKWRFTSPTHVVRAFEQALDELTLEGGVQKRYERYQSNQVTLVKGMRSLGFLTLIPDHLHSPVITSFISPKSIHYNFTTFYQSLKENGFVIYPGKISSHDTFRIGTIGEVYLDDINKLLSAITSCKSWD